MYIDANIKLAKRDAYSITDGPNFQEADYNTAGTSVCKQWMQLTAKSYGKFRGSCPQDMQPILSSTWILTGMQISFDFNYLANSNKFKLSATDIKILQNKKKI